jgi:trafficking protein particle complex subunit 11
LASIKFWIFTADQLCAVNRIILEDEESTSLIRGVKFGVLEPGAETVKTLYLSNTGAVGDRTLDVSVRSQPTAYLRPSPIPQTADSGGLHDVNETLQTLVIPTTQAIKITSNVTYQRSLQPHPGLADLRTYGSDFWGDRVSGEATITSIFQCAALCGLKLEGIQLENQVQYLIFDSAV